MSEPLATSIPSDLTVMPPVSRPRVLVHHTRCDLCGEDFAREAERRLSPSDGRRARSYRRLADRCRYLAGRLLLRSALSEFRPAGERDLLEKIRTDAHGRPALPQGPNFNLSHSGAVVACAVSPDGRVGIDVERIRPLNLEAFASSFSVAEWRLVAGATSPPAAFFRYWTMKESVLKADGRGLSVPLLEIRISETEGFLEGNRWNLHELDIGPEYASHLAVDHEDVEIQVREVPPELLLDDPRPAAAAPGALNRRVFVPSR
jgi:4'-phosphopantetheinyl transferase